MREISLFTEPLEKAGIVYCLVGAVAAIAYGRPRMTLDADLLLALHPRHARELRRAFPESDFYLPPEEVLLAEIQRPSRGHFNIIHQHSAWKADCYLPGRSPLAAWELARRRKIRTPFGEAWFAPPESVILHKLLFYKEGGSLKHLEDIRSILDSGQSLDMAAMEIWLDSLDLHAEWAKASQAQL